MEKCSLSVTIFILIELVQKGGKNRREVRGGEDLSTGLAQDVLTSALCIGRA